MTNKRRRNTEGPLYNYVQWDERHRNKFVAIVIIWTGFVLLVDFLRRVLS